MVVKVELIWSTVEKKFFGNSTFPSGALTKCKWESSQVQVGLRRDFPNANPAGVGCRDLRSCFAVRPLAIKNPDFVSS